MLLKQVLIEITFHYRLSPKPLFNLGLLPFFLYQMITSNIIQEYKKVYLKVYLKRILVK